MALQPVTHHLVGQFGRTHQRGHFLQSEVFTCGGEEQAAVTVFVVEEEVIVMQSKPQVIMCFLWGFWKEKRLSEVMQQ